MTAVLPGVTNDFDPGDYTATEGTVPRYVPGVWSGACESDGSVTLRPVTPENQDNLTCFITNIATSTTQQLRTTTTTDPGETTTTTLVLRANLPNTGGGQLLPILLAGFGLALLGAGLILLAPRRHPRWVI